MKIKDKAHLQSVIEEAIRMHGPTVSLNHLDVSSVTDMSLLFFASPFNGSIDRWDVSNVLNMRGMFCEAALFNQPIGNWRVSKVESLNHMFFRASAFTYFESFLHWKVPSSCNDNEFFNGKTLHHLQQQVARRALLSVLPAENLEYSRFRTAL
jgi:Mycoplasma protein of unknown function, DUF285